VNDVDGIPPVVTNSAVGLRKQIRDHFDQRTLPTSISRYRTGTITSCYNI